MSNEEKVELEILANMDKLGEDYIQDEASNTSDEQSVDEKTDEEATTGEPLVAEDATDNAEVATEDSEVPVEIATKSTEESTEESTESSEEEVEESSDKVEAVERDDSDDIFITENDTFDVKIKWYKIGSQLFVQDSDFDFEEKDVEDTEVKEFTVTFKYPSQGDYETIMGTTSYRTPDDMKISDIILMELTRLVTLVRRWSLKQDLSRMVDMDPMFIKAILKKVRDEIDMKGIL